MRLGLTAQAGGRLGVTSVHPTSQLTRTGAAHTARQLSCS